MKSQTNSDTIHEAMPDKSYGGEDANPRVMMNSVIGFMNMMDQYEFFKTVKEKKPDNQGNHCARCVDALFMGQTENFRQNVKAHNAQQHASSETENEVQPITELERKQSASKGRDERYE